MQKSQINGIDKPGQILTTNPMFSHSAGNSAHTNRKNLFLFTSYQLLP